MKKKYVVIIVILVALLIGAVVFFMMQNSKQEERKYSIEKVEEFNYFVVQDGENYGVIGKDGNIIIEPKFQSVVIPNPSKAVFVCTPSDEKTKVLNDKNEELFSEYEEVGYIKLKNLASNLMYEKSVLKYKKDGKYGLIDYSGKEITKPLYGTIDALEYKEGELIVEQNGKFGVININGVVLVEPEYETIKTDGYYTEADGYKNAGYIVGIKTQEGYRYGHIDVNGNKILETEFNEISRVSNIKDDNNIYYIASKNGQYGLYKNNSEIINTEYQSIEYNQQNNIFVIEKSRKFGFTDINGKVLVEPKYSQIDITGKYVYVKEKQGDTIVLDAAGNKVDIPSNVSKIAVADEKYNIVMTNQNNKTIYSVEDKNGNEIISGGYTYIEYLFDNYFIVCNEKSMLGVVDDTNNVKIELKYNSIQALKNVNAIQASVTKNNVLTIYNNSFEQLCEVSNAFILKQDEFVKIYNTEDSYYINKDGKVVTNKEIYPENKLFAKQENGKWGFEDKNGNIKVNCQYDRVTEFNEYGYAGIFKNGKWGVIDSDGKVVQEPKYQFTEKTDPTFLGKYYQVTFGFGEVYYSNK